MRVLIVTSAANSGSIGSIVGLLIKGYVSNGHQVKVCYGYYKDNVCDDVYLPICSPFSFRMAAVLTRLFGKEGFYSPLSTRKLIGEINRFKPDLVQLMNIHAYYLNEYEIFAYLKNHNIPTVYSMFDAYAFTGKCPFPLDCKKYLVNCGGCEQRKEYPKSLFFDRSRYLLREKEKAYSGFNNLVFVGGIGIINQAKSSKLLSNKQICLIDEPQELDNMFYPRNTDELKKKLGIPHENKVVLAAIPLDSGTTRKAGHLFLELYEKMKNVAGYSFVYIGFNTTRYGDPEGMIKIPFINSPDEFATFLSLGDVLFFTSMADTTSCTVIDALACGTPVIGFDIEGINCFNITDKSVMNVAPIGDVDYVKAVIEKIPRKDDEVINRCRNSVYGRFNTKTIVNKYLELYQSLVKL